MKKILVTGGFGFIGSNFVKMFWDKYDIVIIDKLTYASNVENLNSVPKFGFYKEDISNYDACDVIFKAEQFDAVINFAAESHVDNSIKNPRVFTETNVLGTQTLLDLSYKYNIEKFIQVSTDEVYGHLEMGDPAFAETTPLSPRSPYSATKASADMLVLAYVNTYGMNASITRCSNNYGPNQHAEKLIPTIVRKAYNNEKIPIYGSGTNIRDWIYVGDHCEGIHRVLEDGKSGEVYNFGGNRELTNLDLCKKILKQLNKPESLIEFVNDRPGHDFRYAIDFTKATNELGWVPRTHFDGGLMATVVTEYGKLNKK
jgi:dTDP-glucose 4,6-dehydratase